MRDHPALSNHPKYRADIDGLRAIAVLAVVLFHAFPEWLTAGFIGVDIFFVISGFLISTILFESLDRGSFSFADFYARRIRRIFPALLVVLAFCFAVGWVQLPADEFKQLTKHIAAGAGFASNFVLWQESGYFDTAAETKPLLHLWSLGIEEQFYIVWPLLLWFAWRGRFNRLALALLLAGGSFLLNIRLLQGQADVAKLYYSPMTRAWQLLTGAVLAYLCLRKPALPHGAASMIGNRNLRALLGAALLAAGMLFISKDQPYPGWWGLLPTLGAALLISAGTSAWFNRVVLSQRLLVWIGLISYPLYLWHWPLLSFARIVEGETPPASVRIGAVAAAVVLAWLTKKYVEDPIRFGARAPLKLKTAAMFSMMVVAGSLGYAGFVKEGWPSRYGTTELKRVVGRFECEDRKKDSGCKFGNARSDKLVVVWGDSHAEHLSNALNDALGSEYRFHMVSNGSCFMGEKVKFPEVGNKRDCNAALEKLQSLRGQEIYAVIRSQRWHGYGGYHKEFIEAAVEDAIHAYGLNPRKVVIVGSTADADFECEVSNYYARPLAERKECKTSEATKGYARLFISTTRAMPVPSNVHFVYPYEKTCPQDVCTVIKDHVSYYTDMHHLSRDGAMLLMPEIMQALTEQKDDQAEH